jgi:hypothetical protein
MLRKADPDEPSKYNSIMVQGEAKVATKAAPEDIKRFAQE